MEKKTILFVMPRLPFPAISGRKTSLYHYCKILSEDLNCNLIVAAFLEKGDNPSNKPDFIDELIVLPKPSFVSKVKNIFINSLLFKKMPLQVSLYWSKEADLKVKELAKIYQPDIAIGDMVRSTEYIKNLDCYTIADLDDRISLRYKRQLETDIVGINPYGAFINTIPKFVKNLLLNKHVKLFVVKKEIKLLNNYELQMGKECDSTIFVAENEVREFNKELGQDKAIAVPIGVDTDYFSYRNLNNKDDFIGFLGALSVAHNENAVKNFIHNIFPKILEQNKNAKFLVIGGGASEELQALSSNNIIFTDRVDDVRTYLEKCKVFVCPMTFGSGIKTKNLEAMSLGLPIVTTSIGAENIDAINEKDWFVADNNNEFADKVVQLLCSSSLANQYSKNGRQFILNNFTWKIARDKFEKIFGGIDNDNKKCNHC